MEEYDDEGCEDGDEDEEAEADVQAEEYEEEGQHEIEEEDNRKRTTPEAFLTRRAGRRRPERADPQAVPKALVHVATKGNDAAIALVAGRLEDRIQAVRTVAATALGELAGQGNATAMACVLPLASHRSPPVRCDAIRVVGDLAGFDDFAAAEVLAARVADKDRARDYNDTHTNSATYHHVDDDTSHGNIGKATGHDEDGEDKE